MTMKRKDLQKPDMAKAVNGSDTFTFEGRKSGGDKATEMRTGWPEWKKGTFERLIEASGKRFDDLMYPNQDGILRGDYKGNR
tara:strand:+ start:311 stop:556 length:246 start_codon:yes stop_codon:yes gene_type:complete